MMCALQITTAQTENKNGVNLTDFVFTATVIAYSL